MAIERRIVLTLIVLVCMLGIIWANTAFAFQNEPTGFRGNKWGTDVKDLTFKVEKATSLEEIKVDFYNILQTSESFESMIITLDGKLVAVITSLKDTKKAKPFATVLLKLYGDPTDLTEETAVWVGETSTIEFSPFEGVVIIGSTIGMQSLEALLEWYAANIKKQAI